MQSIESICQEVVNREGTTFIQSLAETDKYYVIAVLTKDGVSPTQPAYLADKNTGEIHMGTFPEFKKLYRSIKPLEIPAQFQYHGEIKH